MLTFDITNTGFGLLSGTVSESCADYAIISLADYNLTADQTHTVTILFTPGSAGTNECTIDTGNELCSDVFCTGVGTSPVSCEVEPDSLVYGSVYVGSYKDTTFTIINTGGDLLSGDVSESCTDYSIISGGGPYSLAAAESLVVTVRFEPASAGTKECTIETGNGACNDVYCSGVGVNPPACLVDPDTLVYGTVLLGNYSDQTFIIANTGGDLLTGDVSEACGDYSIISGGGPYSLAAAESLVVTVRFEPTSAGVKECTIETGSGLCSDVYCTGVGENPPVCHVDPDSLHYGIIAVDDSLDHTFIITNTGGSVLSGSVSETSEYYELVAGGGPYDLNGGDTLHVTVRYKPTVEGQHECTVETGNGSCGDVYCEGEGSSGIGIDTAVPGQLTLFQNYPNPFNPTTTIAFWLPKKGAVNLSIFDVDGRLIRTLVGGVLEKGLKEYPWNGTDSRGNAVSSGVYFYKLQAGGKELTRKMVLLK
jgi:hypothetical protein